MWVSPLVFDQYVWAVVVPDAKINIHLIITNVTSTKLLKIHLFIVYLPRKKKRIVCFSLIWLSVDFGNEKSYPQIFFFFYMGMDIGQWHLKMVKYWLLDWFKKSQMISFMCFISSNTELTAVIKFFCNTQVMCLLSFLDQWFSIQLLGSHSTALFACISYLLSDTSFH